MSSRGKWGVKALTKATSNLQNVMALEKATMSNDKKVIVFGELMEREKKIKKESQNKWREGWVGWSGKRIMFNFIIERQKSPLIKILLICW